MARIITGGSEIGVATSDRRTGPDGDKELSTGAVTRETTIVRSGLASTKCDTTVSNIEAFGEWTPPMTATTDRNYFLRAYFNFPSVTPAADYNLLAGSLSGSTVVSIRHRTDGKLILSRRVNTPADIGTASAKALIPNVWHRVELKWLVSSAGSNSTCEAYLDGELISSVTGQNFNNTALNRFEVGTSTSPGASWVIYFDDVAFNDDQGSSENSYPGAGRIVLLKPTADSQVGSWTGGTGGTTNLFDAVDNTPPVGTASESNTTQIESADSSGDNSTDEYRATLTTYDAAGVRGRIKLIHPGLWHGEDAATGTTTGSVGMFSNPAGSLKAFTYGADLGALGTWDTNWEWTYADPIYDPAVDLSVAPVMNVRKTDAAANVGSVCFMGALVEFVDAPGLPTGKDTHFIYVRPNK